MRRVLSLVLISLVAVTMTGQFKQFSDVPAYNAAPPTKGQALPPLMAGDQLTGSNFQKAYQAAAYKAAARVPNVLHQLPCYCFCDRSAGHNSLHSCFESVHGAHCTTCMKEAFFAEEQTRKGKTAKQIREAIMKGDYQSFDLEKVGWTDFNAPATAATKKPVTHKTSH